MSTDDKEETPEFQQRLATPVERTVVTVDVGNQTPEQILESVQRWRRYLRKFLAT